MANYNPPTESLTQFNSGVFNAVSGSTGLTISQGDLRYLRFPLGQGGETLPSVNITGSATLNGTTQLIITNTGTNNTFYPTFVSATGSLNSLRAHSGATPFSINPNTGDMRLATTLKIDASNASVSIGNNAGLTTQSANNVAIGSNAGLGTQKQYSVAVGNASGQSTQGTRCVALGNGAGQFTQGDNAIAIGNETGRYTQGVGAIAIGNQAGQGVNGVSLQGANAIAIGNQASFASQTAGSICLNASGIALNPNQAGCFIRPLRGVPLGIGVGRVFYDTATFELQYSTN